MNTAAIAVMFALGFACAARPTSPQGAPGQGAQLRLTAQANRTDVAPGAPAVVTFRLENLTSTPITLDFGSTCQVMPYVARRASGDVVHPADGSWVCATMLTELTLPPNGVTTTELRVASGAGSGEAVGLPPGEYAVFARLHDRTHKLESNRVMLTVR
ncbi:MAG TPA: hypothetical protein VMN81_07400 [Vicinamibacterales bacterium]|nr:hypothetical protein [Vicinamibacterales bacterium]